jgi:hypothetical protein
MIAQSTIHFGNFAAKARKKIPGWTMPFLVAHGQKFMKRSGNANLRLVQKDESVSVETSQDNAYEQEYGTIDEAGDGNLQSTALDMGDNSNEGGEE